MARSIGTEKKSLQLSVRRGVGMGRALQMCPALSFAVPSVRGLAVEWGQGLGRTTKILGNNREGPGDWQ